MALRRAVLGGVGGSECVDGSNSVWPWRVTVSDRHVVQCMEKMDGGWNTIGVGVFFSTLHSPSHFVRDQLHSPTSPPSSLPSSPTSAKERPTFPTILAYRPYPLPYLCAALCLWSGAYIDMLLTAAGDLRRDDSLRRFRFALSSPYSRTALAIFFILHLR